MGNEYGRADHRAHGSLRRWARNMVLAVFVSVLFYMFVAHVDHGQLELEPASMAAVCLEESGPEGGLDALSQESMWPVYGEGRLFPLGRTCTFVMANGSEVDTRHTSWALFVFALAPLAITALAGTRTWPHKTAPR
jgi:hypothetical protein